MKSTQSEKPILFLKKPTDPLTAEKLRTFPGCEHYSDQEAEELINSIMQLTVFLLETLTQSKIHLIDNQQIVYLNEEQNDEKVKHLFATNHSNSQAA